MITPQSIRDASLSPVQRVSIKEVIAYYTVLINDTILQAENALIAGNVNHYIMLTTNVNSLQKELSAYLFENVLRDLDNIV